MYPCPTRSSLRSLQKGPDLLSPPSASPVPTPAISRTLLGNFEVVTPGFHDWGFLGEVGWWSMAWMDKENSWHLFHGVFSHPRNHCFEDALHHLAA